MKIAVCVKQAIDTEAPLAIDANGQVAAEGAAHIIDPYAEFAVEKAVQLKEEHGGEVLIVAIGGQESMSVIRHALSMGATRAILVDDSAIDAKSPEAKARVLSAVLKQEQPNLILGGCKSGDTAHGQTLPRVAACLGMNHVGWGIDIRLDGEQLLVDRETDNGVVRIALNLPVLVTAQQGLASPRYPTVPNIMQARKKPVEVKDLASLGLNGCEVNKGASRIKVLSSKLAPGRVGGYIVEGGVSQAVSQTIHLLATEAKVL
jgi:electron transfer flavoprotein beta subunit